MEVGAARAFDRENKDLRISEVGSEDVYFSSASLSYNFFGQVFVLVSWLVCLAIRMETSNHSNLLSCA